MALIRQSIPALYGGVSQQAAAVRAANQCEAGENCYFSIAHGASKRPPLEFVNMLTDFSPGFDVPTGNRFFMHFTHPSGRDLLLMLPGDGSYTVYDLASGLVITAENDSEQTYLTSEAEAWKAFRALSVADKVFIVNTEVHTAVLPDLAPGAISGSAQTLQDDILDTAEEGSVWQILGDEVNPVDTYYAKKVAGKWVEWLAPGATYKLDPATMPHVLTFETDDVSPTFGIKSSHGAWTWAEKQVGDVKSNKFPTFATKRIRGLFHAHDRLGFLADNHVCMSETGEYHNFFRKTVTDVLDTDRIDVTVNSDGNHYLQWAKPLAKSIILFGGERQFSMDGNPYMSPKTVSVTQSTAYPASGQCAPESAGPNVFFATNTSRHTQLFEMFVQADTVSSDAANVGSHVPQYVEGRAVQLAANNNYDLVALRIENSEALYVYQFYWNGDEKAQSAWSRWTLGEGTKLLHTFALREHLYVIYSTSTSGGALEAVMLGRFNLQLKTASMELLTDLPYPVNLDHAQKVTGTYDPVLDRTTFFSAFPIMDDQFRSKARLVYAEGANAGRAVRLTQPGPTVVYEGVNAFSFALQGYHAASPVILGTNYTQAFTLSEQFYADGSRATLNARLQLRTLNVAFTDTGFFRVEVKVKGHDPSQHAVLPYLLSTYTARTVGNEDLMLNTPQVSSGTYRFPVLGKSDEVRITFINDEFMPSHFINAEWEGLVTTRTRR